MQYDADVCLILEGTYPYVSGGVSSWTHDLLRSQSEFTFHLLTLVPADASLELRFELPENVVGLTPIVLQQLPKGTLRRSECKALLGELGPSLDRFMSQGGLETLNSIVSVLRPQTKNVGRDELLNSKPAWELLLQMYESRIPEGSFLDYFWTWRTMMGAFYSIMLCDLPKVKLFHPVSTGYAGLLAARGHLETGSPVVLTEHGIYSNERRIEIAMATWLHEVPHEMLSITNTKASLKDVWNDVFASYSRTCYEACEQVITIFEGNQEFQLQEGANPNQLCVIPNGIDFERYSTLKKPSSDHPPTIALIGRVVPIKDVKTFLRASAILRKSVPNLRVFVMGPTTEDPEYFSECQEMVKALGLSDCLEFTGMVRIEDYLERVDITVLTSISEAQPLVLLEAGAAGIPSVATDVGACREMILGRPSEMPPIGPAGEVTALSNPEATAAAIERLLNDPEKYRSCSQAIRQRVKKYYNKAELDSSYRQLYASLLARPTVQLEEVR